MKKLFTLIGLSALLLAPTTGADAAKPSILVKDGVVTIDFPSTYKHRHVDIEDGHHVFKQARLNAKGDAIFDLKQSKAFRTQAPGAVYVSIQGANRDKPYARNTNLKTSLSGHRLMFKEQYNQTEYFELKAHTLPGFFHASYANATLAQSDKVKREAEKGGFIAGTDLFHFIVKLPVSTAPTFGGVSRPVKASFVMDEVSGASPYEHPRTADFVFDGKSYKGIVLR